MAFIGRSNVGKSSLLNMLAGRRRLARTSRVPGKTRTVNCYKVNNRVLFLDLPGFGYAKVSKALRAQWSRFVSSYLTQRKELCAVVHLIDCRHPPMALDREVLIKMRSVRVEYLIALTKADKLSGSGRAASRKQVDQVLFECGVRASVTMCSTIKRTGRSELLNLIGAAVTQPARNLRG